jgi:hypothetical protein
LFQKIFNGYLVDIDELLGALEIVIDDIGERSDLLGGLIVNDLVGHLYVLKSLLEDLREEQ